MIPLPIILEFVLSLIQLQKLLKPRNVAFQSFADYVAALVCRIPIPHAYTSKMLEVAMKEA